MDPPYFMDPEPELPPTRSMLRSGGFLANSKVTLIELILLPWIAQAVILATFLQAGANGLILTLVLVPSVLLVLSVLFLRYHLYRGNYGEVAIAGLVVVAIVIATAVGLHAELKWLNEYHRLSQGASYFNVLPSEPAASKNDATTLDFIDTAFVQADQTYGYADISGPKITMYCVAPVASASDPLNTNRVQYWAVGTGCCTSRSMFRCGAATDSSAHGGVVLSKATSSLPGYQAALSGAMSLYDLLPSDSHILLTWTNDPTSYRQKLFNSSAFLFLIFGCTYLIISTVFGIMLNGQLRGGSYLEKLLGPESPPETRL